MIAALFAPIQDCDETFNYWEPAHYLSHGYGLQTWEYSPDYAIRSWLYIALHAVVGNVRRILPQSTKVSLFHLCANELLAYLFRFPNSTSFATAWPSFVPFARLSSTKASV